MEFVINVVSRALAQFGDMEYYTFALIGVMIGLWVIGSVMNNTMAKKTFNGLKESLVSEFAAPATTLHKESNSHYFGYSSGRLGCSGMSCSFHLSPRQDFVSRFVVSWFWPSWFGPDRVVIDISGAEIDPAVSALICRKYQAKQLEEKFVEIKKFAKPYNGALDNGMFSKHSSSSLTGFTYICDAGGRAIGPAVFGKTSTGFAGLDDLKYILISGSTRRITVEFEKIPSHWENAIHLVLRGVLDPLTEIKVSDSVRAEVMANRDADAIREKEAAEREAREEAANKRNADKRKERDEMMKRMTPEQVRKLEEKEEKKQRKKKMASGRMYL